MTQHIETRTPSVAERILAESIALFEEGGPDAVAVREVATRARVSLREIYKLFGSRDELIVAAIAEWMQTNVYGTVAVDLGADATVFDVLIEQLHQVFEPWERNPRALETFVYARSTATGDTLLRQGVNAMGPLSDAMFATTDPELAADVGLIVTDVVYAMMGQIAAGQRSIEEMAPTIERVIRRLSRCT